jgi:hypothetical protein
MVPLTAGIFGPQQGGSSSPDFSISSAICISVLTSAAAAAVVADLSEFAGRCDGLGCKGDPPDRSSDVLHYVKVFALADDMADTVITLTVL